MKGYIDLNAVSVVNRIIWL